MLKINVTFMLRLSEIIRAMGSRPSAVPGIFT